MNFKLWLENDIFQEKEKTQSSNIGKMLGFTKPLMKFSEGTFATLYQHPIKSDRLIKVTAHKSDVLNIVKSQKLNSENIVKVFNWPDKKQIKEIGNSLAIIVEKIIGTPMVYTTSDFYDLSLGNFEFAHDWLESGGHKTQQKILNRYNKNEDSEHTKLSNLFRTLGQIEKFYKIELSDFQDNILDTGDRYVIVDMGF